WLRDRISNSVRSNRSRFEKLGPLPKTSQGLFWSCLVVLNQSRKLCMLRETQIREGRRFCRDQVNQGRRAVNPFAAICWRNCLREWSCRDGSQDLADTSKYSRWLLRG